jgi:hypothetical protein
MYGDYKPEKQAYVDTLLWGEVGSMLAESKVHNELGLNSKPPTFFYKDQFGKDAHIEIGEYADLHGIKGLFDFLKTAIPARSDQQAYGTYYEKSYADYADQYEGTKPAAKPIIQEWLKNPEHLRLGDPI